MQKLQTLTVLRSNGSETRTNSEDFNPIIFYNEKQKDEYRKQKERELNMKEKQDNPEHPATVSVYLVLQEVKDFQPPVIEEELPQFAWRKPRFKHEYLQTSLIWNTTCIKVKNAHSTTSKGIISS